MTWSTSSVDWDRRYALMRTHTMLHILCGVMWNGYGVVVTGGNMEPLSGRLDFEFPEVPEGFKESLEAALNDEVAADRPIEVSFVPRSEAVLDESLIRTKVSLVPESVHEVRVVDIVGSRPSGRRRDPRRVDVGGRADHGAQGRVEGEGLPPHPPRAQLTVPSAGINGRR